MGKPAPLAREAGRTPAQVLICWSIQKGFVPLPKSVTPERQLLATPWASGAAGAFDATLASVEQSVDAVGLGAIDLLLLHVSGAPDGRAEAWQALDAALDEGLMRAIAHCRRCAAQASNAGVPG